MRTSETVSQKHIQYSRNKKSGSWLSTKIDDMLAGRRGARALGTLALTVCLCLVKGEANVVPDRMFQKSGLSGAEKRYRLLARRDS
jgi:hypothetical protein